MRIDGHSAAWERAMDNYDQSWLDEYYENSFDIEAELTFIPTDEGGRSMPAKSGYRPQFFYDGHDWDAIYDYGDVEEVAPGETVLARLRFLSPQCHVGKLFPGKEFLLREGQRVVGHGTVTRILNLAAHAGEMRRKFGDCDTPMKIPTYEYMDPRPKYKRKKRKERR
jgi:elongation factor Tu-like protein